MPKLILKKGPFEETVAMVGVNGLIIASKITPKEGDNPIYKHIELNRLAMLRLYLAMDKQLKPEVI